MSSPLLQMERARLIAEEVLVHSSVRVVDLVERFGVSGETIRRDLELLEQQGVVRRVYGGAVDARQSPVQLYHSRKRHRVAAKRAIGALAASLVEDGETIIIDVGTTALSFAMQLFEKKRLTVITPSLQVALLMKRNSDARVIVTGGELEDDEPYLTGPIAEGVFERFHANRAFIAAGGLSLDRGLTDYNDAEVQVRKVMLKSASQIIGLIDSSKMGVRATSVIGDITALDMMVTDSGIAGELTRGIQESGVEVLVAEVTEEE
ncbi:DeoR/GlpR family DNA-binding transcription regulator [Alicyclobacillus sp. ALC3]|uniref:DeoR/GlpR family DNA-binding transcription regulator n=1 Tax=Alicyclobacillus sp. ALC3 TaxID=2796143 RepID=UPI002378CF1E|nr:DeoR/GlpR family DNA-binding transcription regulator [Alicyclobacillus sp. ALC3]